jgi:hypothetical protein
MLFCTSHCENFEQVGYFCKHPSLVCDSASLFNKKNYCSKVVSIKMAVVTDEQVVARLRQMLETVDLQVTTGTSAASTTGSARRGGVRTRAERERNEESTNCEHSHLSPKHTRTQRKCCAKRWRRSSARICRRRRR